VCQPGLASPRKSVRPLKIDVAFFLLGGRHALHSMAAEFYLVLGRGGAQCGLWRERAERPRRRSRFGRWGGCRYRGPKLIGGRVGWIMRLPREDLPCRSDISSERRLQRLQLPS
jgi:hypothetical protein